MRQRALITLVCSACIVIGVLVAIWGPEEFYLWRLKCGDEPQQVAAAVTLANMQSVRAVQPLLGLLERRPFSDDVYEVAVLARRGPLEASSPDIFLSIERGADDKAILLVREDCDKAWTPLTNALNWPGACLIKIGDGAVLPLLKKLRHPNGYVRLAAVIMLGEMVQGGSKAEASMRDMLKELVQDDTYSRIVGEALRRIQMRGESYIERQ